MSLRCFCFIAPLILLSFTESATISNSNETTSLPPEGPSTTDLPSTAPEFPTTQPWSEVSSTVSHTDLPFPTTDAPSYPTSNSTVPSVEMENGSSSDDLLQDEFEPSEAPSTTDQPPTSALNEELELLMEVKQPPIEFSSLVQNASDTEKDPMEAEKVTPGPDVSATPNFADFTDNNINFTLGLYNSLATSKKHQENVFFSPLSIFTTLLMLHYGAKGETAEELSRALDINALSPDIDLVHNIYGQILDSISDDPTSKSYLLMANKIFLAEGFEIVDEYQKGIGSYYNASVQPVSFIEPHTTYLINAWVESKTKGHISNLFKSALPASTSAVILNALYFKGNWQYEFSPISTVHNSPFYLDSGSVVNVSMMVNKVKLAYGESWELGASILELPYIGDRLSMFVILPKDNATLEEVEENVNLDNLKVLLRSMKRRVINIRLPKFQIRDAPSIVESLKELGVHKLFSSEADLSGLAEGSFAVSEIKHEASIEVSETGSVASAATGVILERLGSSYEQHFEADRPFIFFIIDKQNGLILFMGRIGDPTV